MTTGEQSLIGQTIGGRFVPTKLLGEGGMGYVYKAIQQPTNREVALKILKEDYMSDEVIRNRFLREAEVIAKMSHPNIVMLFDSGLEERLNVLFMAMEFLKGSPLSDVIADELGSLTLDRIFIILLGMAGALSEAHKNGIIHRDLKPENVFLITDHEGNEVPKVLDFGFARLQGSTKKLTQFGVAFGTPHYMSPEQAMGKVDITAAADIYAVGVMMYELICGEVPYNGSNAMEIMTKQVNSPTPAITPRPELGGVPPELIKLIQHCMEKKPEARPADGTALFNMLQAIRGGGSGVVDVSSTPHPVPSSGGSAAPISSGDAAKKQMYLYGGLLILAIILTAVITALVTG